MTGAWHVFQQSVQIAVLRLHGSRNFRGPVQLAPVRPANAASTSPSSNFKTISAPVSGTRLKRLKRPRTIPTDDHRFLYRVTAVGEANKVPITWIYYLCAAPNGLQVSFVFAVETALRDRRGTATCRCSRACGSSRHPKSPKLRHPKNHRSRDGWPIFPACVLQPVNPLPAYARRRILPAGFRKPASF